MPAKELPFAHLVEAAEAFAEELGSYAALSEAFQRAPFVTGKHLERINDLLGQISESEQRLGQGGQRLAQAVAIAREEQERLARATLERIPAVKGRMAEIQGLVGRFEELGRDAAAINQEAAAFAAGASPAADAAAMQTEQARAILDRIASLAERAQAVSAEAHDASFEQLSQQAHALGQQLRAAHKKLALATVG